MLPDGMGGKDGPGFPPAGENDGRGEWREWRRRERREWRKVAVTGFALLLSFSWPPRESMPSFSVPRCLSSAVMMAAKPQKTRRLRRNHPLRFSRAYCLPSVILVAATGIQVFIANNGPGFPPAARMTDGEASKHDVSFFRRHCRVCRSFAVILVAATGIQVCEPAAEPLSTGVGRVSRLSWMGQGGIPSWFFQYLLQGRVTDEDRQHG